MQAFQALFDRLDQVNGTRAKVTALVDHFRTVPAADAAWALSLLLGETQTPDDPAGGSERSCRSGAGCPSG